MKREAQSPKEPTNVERLEVKAFSDRFSLSQVQSELAQEPCPVCGRYRRCGR